MREEISRLDRGLAARDLESALDHSLDISEPESVLDHRLDISEPELALDHRLDISEPESALDHRLDISEPESVLDHRLDTSEPESVLDHRLDSSEPESALDQSLDASNLKSGTSSELKHYALLLAYEGADFHGWQDQANALTVQAVLRSAWRELSGEDLHFQGSSRTDAGVSARGHVTNFATRTPIPYDRLPRVLNAHLPNTIRVRAIKPVEPDFNARHLARGKLYVYRIFNHLASSALLSRLTCHAPQRLDLPAMQAVADYLCGEHDFTAFMDQGSVVRQTVRRLDRLEVIADPQLPLINLVCLGPAFLYHQVRILAGTLYYVGQGKLDLATIKTAMARKDRKPLGKTMPPQGLCLERVFYPQTIFGGDSLKDYQTLLEASREELWQQIRLA